MWGWMVWTAAAGGLVCGVLLMWALRGRAMASAVAKAEKQLERKYRRALGKQREAHEEAVAQLRQTIEQQSRRLSVVAKVHAAEMESVTAEAQQWRARAPAPAPAYAPTPADHGDSRPPPPGDDIPTLILDP